MGDLVAAAKKQYEYAKNEYLSGDEKKGDEHRAKADAFIDRIAGAEPGAPAEPVAVDSEVVENNAVPNEIVYAATSTLEGFTAKYGRSPEQVYSEVVTGLLRPNPDRWAVFDANGDHDAAERGRRDDATRQQAVIDYFAGKVPFSAVAVYLGSWFDDLGLVDINTIHDLGA